MLLHQRHYLACPEVPAFYPQYAVAVVEVEINAAAGKMVTEERSETASLGGVSYIGFKHFYH